MATTGVYLGKLLLFLIILHYSRGACVVPSHFWGDFYSIERGIEVNTLINKDGITTETINAKCEDFKAINESRDANNNYHAYVLFNDIDTNCYQCFLLYFRTMNILQFKQASKCGSAKSDLETVCNSIKPETDMLTMFKTTLVTVNCKQTFEGVYQFSYEINEGGGGICDTPSSITRACQEPGSQYLDNQVFYMDYGKCDDVSSIINGISIVRDIKYQCMGTWYDENDNIYSALADVGEDIPRDRYKCMLTRNDQQRRDNKKRHTISRWAGCSTLKSPYEGDIRLLLHPVLGSTQLVQPSCNLPLNFTGTWFNTGEFDTDVIINQTHVYYKTKIDQFTYKETFFTCQQNRDSRFLMTAVTVGKCEIDYVCFDFMPRHHNIIRWRMGKPYRQTQAEMALPDFLERKFRQACTWQSFTIDRNDIAWTYDTFILNPPAPVDCPLGGRYHFNQVGDIEEHYVTRIRGITERPRHMIDCREYVTEFKSCENNPTKILVDADYCATLDHTGRPIGEYDEPDRELSCVGFWMEDMRSYLITYDEEDATSKFRCWVYERLDWRDLVASRATRAKCGRTQTAKSSKASEGASLHLELKEAERIFDSCPQRYNTGRDPYDKEAKIYVVGAASTTSASIVFITILSLVWVYL